MLLCKVQNLELCSESSIQYRSHSLVGLEALGHEMRELWIQGARLIHWVRLASALENGHCR
jgi:hypothetical protein